MVSTRQLRRLMRAMIILMVTLSLLIVALVSLRAVVRALPGRYAYYLPEPLLELRHVPHDNTLPTPVVEGTPALTILPPTATPVPPTPTATPQPTHVATHTPAPTLTPSATPTPVPTLPATVMLEGLRQERQGWNNCGPTTLAMQLSFWGCAETQREIAPVLKPNPEDKNVGPHELADYARSRGFEAVIRPGGDIDLLKQLIANAFPVMVETWHVHTPSDQMGHYRLIVGYTEITQTLVFTTYDSLSTPPVRLEAQALDELWRAFNRLYLVVYPQERGEDVAAILGPAMDERQAVESALATAYAEARTPPQTCVAYADCANAETFAWFNVGTNLTALGQYEEAAAAYDQARALGVPYRMIWYQFGPYEAYYAVGRYADVIALADATLRVTSNLEESYYWRGKAKLAQENVAGARADFEAALRYHEGWAPAQAALDALK